MAVTTLTLAENNSEYLAAITSLQSATLYDGDADRLPLAQSQASVRLLAATYMVKTTDQRDGLHIH
jgi:hypothetical protein